MSKRLQVVLTDEAWKIVENLSSEANHNFDAGNITYSDAINELILCSKPDVRELQLKHTSLRRSLVVLAQLKDLDLDMVIKKMTELKSRTHRKPSRSNTDHEVTG